MNATIRLGLLLLCLCLTACAAPAAPGLPLSSAASASTETGAEFKPQPEIIWTEPPVLTITAGSASIKATRGSTSWAYENGDGTWTNVQADSMQPLDDASRAFLPQLIYDGTAPAMDGTARLSFEMEPDSLEVVCWHSAHWGNTTAACRSLPMDGDTVSLPGGPHLYEVTARWTAAETYHGEARYAFYAAPSQEAPLLTVESDGVTMIPYPFYAWRQVWTDHGVMCADGLWIDTELPGLAESGVIPAITLGNTLTLHHQESVRVGRYLLFSDAFEALDAPSDWEALTSLAPGTYYVGIDAVVLERFVPEAENYDCSGMVFVFALTIA